MVTAVAVAADAEPHPWIDQKRAFAASCRPSERRGPAPDRMVSFWWPRTLLKSSTRAGFRVVDTAMIWFPNAVRVLGHGPVDPRTEGALSRISGPNRPSVEIEEGFDRAQVASFGLPF